VQCTVEYRPAEGDIFCNCHNGVYDLNGHNVSGPPPRPLEEYKVTLRKAGNSPQEEIVVSRNA
jgi:cytochrome b6-f complex iron-sulfur subunit